jgi:MFS family permease
VVLACTTLGSMVSLLPWGYLADRVAERWVIAVGLGGAAVAVGAAAWAGDVWSLAALLVLAGLLGAGVNSGSGRAVMHWFTAARRGTALGIRQSAVPIAGLATALVLPHLGVQAAFLVLAAWLGAAALTAGVTVREGPLAGDDSDSGPEVAAGPLRDPRMWRLAWASALLISVQMGVVGFAVLFLHERRGVSEEAAAIVVAVVSILGGVLRIATGRWSDALGTRVLPLRRLSAALAVALAATVALVSAPLILLVPALVVAGGLAMSWNGLSFAVAAEAAGAAHSGAAIGFQQTALAVAAAVATPAFAAVVGETSWRAAYGLLTLAPVGAWWVLGSLRG